MKFVHMTLLVLVTACTGAPVAPDFETRRFNSGTGASTGDLNNETGSSSETDPTIGDTTGGTTIGAGEGTVGGSDSISTGETANSGSPGAGTNTGGVMGNPEMTGPVQSAQPQLKSKLGYCLQYNNPKNEAVGIVEQRNCSGGPEQKFTLEKTAGDFVRLKNGAKGTCIGVPDIKVNIYKRDALTVERGAYNVACGQNRDEWKMVTGTGGVRFESKAFPGKCLAMDPSLPYQRSVAILESCAEQNHQNFAIEPFKTGDPVVADPPLTLDERCTLRVNFYDTTAKNENTRIVRENFSAWTKDYNRRFREYIRDHCKLIYKTAADRVPVIRYIDLVLEESNDFGAYVWGGALSFDTIMVFNGSFMSAEEHRNKPEAINGIFAHELTHTWQKSRKGSGYAKMGGIIEGLGDAFKYINPQVKESVQFDLNGSDWDAGYGKTAGVLLYIDKAQPGFLSKLNLDIEDFVGTWDPARIKALTGREAIDWWNQYKSDPNCPNPRIGGYCR